MYSACHIFTGVSRSVAAGAPVEIKTPLDSRVCGTRPNSCRRNIGIGFDMDQDVQAGHGYEKMRTNNVCLWMPPPRRCVAHITPVLSTSQTIPRNCVLRVCREANPRSISDFRRVILAVNVYGLIYPVSATSSNSETRRNSHVGSADGFCSRAPRHSHCKYPLQKSCITGFADLSLLFMLLPAARTHQPLHAKPTANRYRAVHRPILEFLCPAVSRCQCRQHF